MSTSVLADARLLNDGLLCKAARREYVTRNFLKVSQVSSFYLNDFSTLD